MTKLGVNIDHCATLRQARYKDTPRDSGVIIEPDILEIAALAEAGGADSITAHLREDRRHMQDADLTALRKNISVKLNMEMACTLPILEFAEALKPDFACLVPENRREVTTEGGLDVKANFDKVKLHVSRLAKVGTIASVFIDPEPEQIELSKKAGATCVELHTGAYANAWGDTEARNGQLERIRIAADCAHSLGITVNSGHGINYQNVRPLLEAANFNELNIGHSIICRALSVGMQKAVAEMKALIDNYAK